MGIAYIYSSILRMHESKVFDCATYYMGVMSIIKVKHIYLNYSGTCWLTCVIFCVLSSLVDFTTLINFTYIMLIVKAAVWLSLVLGSMLPCPSHIWTHTKCVKCYLLLKIQLYRFCFP